MEKIKQLFLYLDNQLSSTERKQFEELLSKDEELRESFNKYKGNMEELKSLQNIEVDSAYFSNLSARFREKYEQRKKPFYYNKIAVGIATAAILFIVFVYPFSDSINLFENGEISLEELNLYSLNSVNNVGKIEHYDLDDEELELINSRITEQLDIPEAQINRLISINPGEVYRMVEELSDKEVEQIYNDLSQKTIL
jgi:hypothetical protein